MSDLIVIWLAFVGGGGAMLLFLGRQLITDYFNEKRTFVDELVRKQKGINHG